MIRQYAACFGLLVVLGTAAARDDATKNGAAAELSGYSTLDHAITAKLLASRAIHPGYLGAMIAKDANGKLGVTDVQQGSPAEIAGIKPGDLITGLAGHAITSIELFRETLLAKGAGEAVVINLLRDGMAVEATAKLAAVSRPMKLGMERASLGAIVAEAKEGEGALIERVTPDSPAARAGVRPGDVLLKINGEQVTRPGELADSLAERKPGDTLTLTIRHEKAESDVKVQLSSDAGRAFGPGGGGGRGPAAFAPQLWKKNLFRLAVIPIEFPDVKHNDKIPLKEWDDALFSRDVYVNKNNATDQAVAGSLNDYFHEQSYGAFRFEGKVFDWVEVSKKRMDYSQGSGTSNRSVVLVEAVEKLEARDGKEALKDFDGVFFIYAGDRVNTNRGALYYPHSSMFLHQNKRWLYVLAPEGGSRMTMLSGYAREFGQLLGLPSLAARTENAGSEGCGVWCLMSNPITSGRPQHLCAWSKEQLGWIKPVVIDPSVKQKLILGPIEDAPNECVKVLVRPDGSEYFLLENRRKKGFDVDLPSEGMLIWRVVDNRPVLEESHGIEGPLGPRSQLQHVPYPSPANHSFTPFTTPSSQSPKGGGMTVWITNVQRLADGGIAFGVGHEYR